MDRIAEHEYGKHIHKFVYINITLNILFIYLFNHMFWLNFISIEKKREENINWYFGVIRPNLLYIICRSVKVYNQQQQQQHIFII